MPQKQEPHQTWLIVGGDKIQYPWDVYTPTADLTTDKILFNSTISTPGVKFFIANIKNVHLNMPLDRFKYIDLIPEEINKRYNINDIMTDGWVYIEIQKGMYGLPQVGV